mgnify:CR=1 FL=1|tara:strand:+ start:398 stop:577 length:180 start_codon:yes stop_codon:yes gene_type:complete
MLDMYRKTMNKLGRAVGDAMFNFNQGYENSMLANADRVNNKPIDDLETEDNTFVENPTL